MFAVQLEGDQAHHLAHVMRASVGTEVVLFDGTGAEFSARVAKIDRRSVELEILERREVDRELGWPLTLAVALPKGDRRRYLVEKAVELGVTDLVPLVTQRGIAPPGASAIDRLRRTAIEASKQCGRNRLMAIAPARDVGDLLAQPADGVLSLIAQPGGMPLDELEAAAPSGKTNGEQGRAVRLAVGPEGGFTPEERNTAEAHGWQAIDLGPRILRIETAALALVARLVLG